MTTDDQRGLTRARIALVALDLIQDEGFELLTMRRLAERLRVKAASLYWHVRDRDELVELLASAVLAEVRLPAGRGAWREEALAVCSAVARAVTRNRDGARIVLDAPEALERSDAHARLERVLTGAGLAPHASFETATMMLAAVLVRSLERPEALPPPRQPMQVAIDSGSRGVTLRAGNGMTGLVRSAHDPDALSPVVTRGEKVTVRRLRGGRQGELELNPEVAWRFHIQAPTWNTRLLLTGLDVREIKIDSGAARIECVLPIPRGTVPIDIASGVAAVRFRRPRGVPCVAEISAGSLQLRLDGEHFAGTAFNTRWESVRAAGARDHYLLKIAGGTARITLEEDESLPMEPEAPEIPSAPPGVQAALEVALDGVEARLSPRRPKRSPR